MEAYRAADALLPLTYISLTLERETGVLGWKIESHQMTGRALPPTTTNTQTSERGMTMGREKVVF